MTTALPTTQSAWIQTAKGSVEDVLVFRTDALVPKVEKGEVLVKVDFVSLNPAGMKLMGLMPGWLKKMPAIPEFDLSGTVVDTQGSTRFAAGDEVFGTIPPEIQLRNGTGALCQYAVVRDEFLAKKPSTLSFEQASGLPVAGATAYDIVVVKGGLKAGQRVFINGGGSSVGRFAIQIAKSIGAYVVTSCSAFSRDACLALGADETIDYTIPDFSLASHLSTIYPSSFDLALDCISSQSLFLSSSVWLLSGSQYIDSGAVFPKGWLHGVSLVWTIASNLLRPSWLGCGPKRRWVYYMMDLKMDHLERLGALAEEGKLTVSIDSVHDWDREGLMTAYARLATGKVRGKVVVKVGDGRKD